MQVLGFNFTKINAIKLPNFKFSGITTNITFVDITEQNIKTLNNLDTLKVSFTFSVNYQPFSDKKDKSNKKIKDSDLPGKIDIDGTILLSVEKADSTKILKTWKNKDLPDEFKSSLFNLILNKCSVKALVIEDDLNLPHHLPIPKVQLSQKK